MMRTANELDRLRNIARARCHLSRKITQPILLFSLQKERRFRGNGSGLCCRAET